MSLQCPFSQTCTLSTTFETCIHQLLFAPFLLTDLHASRQHFLHLLLLTLLLLHKGFRLRSVHDLLQPRLLPLLLPPHIFSLFHTFSKVSSIFIFCRRCGSELTLQNVYLPRYECVHSCYATHSQKSVQYPFSIGNFGLSGLLRMSTCLDMSVFIFASSRSLLSSCSRALRS